MLSLFLSDYRMTQQPGSIMATRVSFGGFFGGEERLNDDQISASAVINSVFLGA